MGVLTCMKTLNVYDSCNICIYFSSTIKFTFSHYQQTPLPSLILQLICNLLFYTLLKGDVKASSDKVLFYLQIWKTLKRLSAPECRKMKNCHVIA